MYFRPLTCCCFFSLRRGSQLTSLVIGLLSFFSLGEEFYREKLGLLDALNMAYRTSVCFLWLMAFVGITQVRLRSPTNDSDLT